jgi:NTP pyrophosphatase (non-canonical NTP hydrolase)
MTPEEYQKAVLRTEHTPLIIQGDLAKSRLLHALFGICTEAGELQDVVKRHLMYGAPLDYDNIIEELGDLLWYIALGCVAVHVKLEGCMIRNITKLKVRYPGKFTSDHALNRDLEAEQRAMAADSESTCCGGCAEEEETPRGDPVNHPSYYNTSDIEVIDAIEAWDLNFNRGNSVKYVVRAGHKDLAKEIEDLKKARFYLDHEIARMEKKA